MAGEEERQATPQHDQLQALMRLCSDLDNAARLCPDVPGNAFRVIGQNPRPCAAGGTRAQIFGRSSPRSAMQPATRVLCTGDWLH
eukprot:1157256-Pelagomonas_calceolata.AAC.1